MEHVAQRFRKFFKEESVKMDGVHSALIACVLYGVSNVLLDRHGREVSALTASTYYSCGVFLLCLLVQGKMRMQGTPPTPYPDSVSFGMLCLMVLIYFMADYLYLNAFAQQANLFAITIMATLVPVVAAAVKFGLDREVPDARYVVAWVFASISIILIAKK